MLTQKMLMKLIKKRGVNGEGGRRMLGIAVRDKERSKSEEICQAVGIVCRLFFT